MEIKSYACRGLENKWFPDMPAIRKNGIGKNVIFINEKAMGKRLWAMGKKKTKVKGKSKK
jgi:hypothetical protein